MYNARVHCGRQLALEHPVEADIVGSVPESGNAAAHGYSLEVRYLIWFNIFQCLIRVN